MIWEKWSLCQERVVSRRSHTIPWGPLFPTQSDASPAQPHQVEVTTGSSGFLCLCSLISGNSSPPFYTSSNASGSPQSMSHGSNKIFTTWTFDPSVGGTDIFLLLSSRAAAGVHGAHQAEGNSCSFHWLPVLPNPLPATADLWKLCFMVTTITTIIILTSSLQQAPYPELRPALSIVLTSDIKRVVSPWPSFLQSEVFLKENFGVPHRRTLVALRILQGAQICYHPEQNII